MLDSFQTDELDSDGLEEILAISRAEYISTQDHTNAEAGSSRPSDRPSYPQRQQLETRLSSLNAEIEEVEFNIKDLEKLRGNLLAQRREITAELEKTKEIIGKASGNGKGKAKAKPASVINYNATFDWSEGLKARMRKVFGINSFRLCQEGVCNANMDNRDIVCVMPTGGGKSLTYQLPALLVPGCTLVISPLIALMTDQILHLREAGVEAVMLTGSTSKEEARDIQNRLTAMALGREGDTPDIKLCYVTPEKLAKSKTFMALLDKLYKGRKLARVVIDEAHCVSQMGHDYRPDYQKLNIVRKMFPTVPILALSATCPPKVLKDLMLVLQMMHPIQNGTSAGIEGTVYFSAPLYRKNLHYKVLPKPAKNSDMILAMGKYISEHHKGHSGIIYCLSKKDTETVAKELHDKNGIRAGVYHADIGDSQKVSIHKRWRKGEVDVVCATIAFGLGIDKGDVRFVLHHSIPKSVEGFYQESGRAGRDGKDADCVLFYRPQDATRLIQLTVSEPGSQDKVRDILRFAQDLDECRNVQFASYFSSSSQVSVDSWTTQEKDALERCGHCDNCTRSPDFITRKDMRLPAWQILRVVNAVQRNSGQVTISQLADLVRRPGKATFSVVKQRRGAGKSEEKVELDLDTLIGGKVGLSKEDTETLCVRLLIERYLQEDFHATAYSVNVYVIPGQNAVRLSRLSRDDVEKGKGPALECSFLNKTKGKGTPGKSAKAKPGSSKDANRTGTKRKRHSVSASSGGDIDENVLSFDDEPPIDALRNDISAFIGDDEFDTPDEDADEDEDAEEWQSSFRKGTTLGKRARNSDRIRPQPPRPAHTDKEGTDDGDVISLSSD